MKAPTSLKIQGKEYLREIIAADTPKKAKPKKMKKPSKLPTTAEVLKMTAPKEKPLLKASKAGENWDMVEVVPHDLVVTAKVKIPKELWAPIHKVIGDDKVALKKLKKLLKAGEPEELISFAKEKGLDYDVLRKMMSIVNPDIHVKEVLSGVLAKAVRALKDAGVVSPISIEQGTLWSAWMKAIDEDAKG